MSDEQLSALISDIYDAALDPSLWLGVLDASSRFIGGRAAGLYSKDSVSKTANVAYNFGVDPQYVRSYVEKYVRMDPSTPSLFFFSVEEIIATADMYPYEEFLETRFYKEWVQPQGWADWRPLCWKSRRRVMPLSAYSGMNGTAWSTMKCAAACGCSCRMYAAPCSSER